MNKYSNLIECLLFNLKFISFHEILSTEGRSNRKCNIQKNWFNDAVFVDFSYSDDLDLHILIGNGECIINVQNYTDVQLIKSEIASCDFHKQVKEFVLDEPIISLGTTNIFVLSDEGLHLFKKVLHKDELNFLSTLLNDNFPNIDTTFFASIDSELSCYIIDCLQSGEVKLDTLKNTFNMYVDSEKIAALNEMGLTVN